MREILLGTSIDEKALELMENEEANCYSCKHYRLKAQYAMVKGE